MPNTVEAVNCIFLCVLLFGVYYDYLVILVVIIFVVWQCVLFLYDYLVVIIFFVFWFFVVSMHAASACM